jgi:hypothetical protein
MTDLFKDLVNRNKNSPSDEVIQPRLLSFYESSSVLGGEVEARSSLAEVEMSLAVSSLAPNFINGKNSEDRSFSRKEDPSQGTNLPSRYNAHSQADPGGEEVESVLNKAEVNPQTISVRGSISPRLPQSSVHGDHQAVDINRLRAETVVTNEEKVSGWAAGIDPKKNQEELNERVIRPRLEKSALTNLEGRTPRSSAQAPREALKPRLLDQHHAEENSSESPVVRIHIGRIDVRAVMQSPNQATTKSAPAQPRLTLDDYLRQREGQR